MIIILTVNQIIDEFLVDQQIKGNSPNTISFYKHTLSFFSDFVSGNSRDISTIDIETCKAYKLSLNDKDINSISVQTYIRSLRAFLSYCYQEEYISENIPEKFKLPKAQKKTIDVLTVDEIKRLFNCFDTKTFLGLRNYCICSLMLDSGLRLNEVVTLESGNIHLAENYIIVNGKGNKQRFVPLGLNTKKYLIKYISRIPYSCDKTPLFVKDTLTPIKIETIKQLFRRLKTRANIPRLKPHLLRHTFATTYLMNGGDIYSLQMILGHTSLEMTKKYVHLTSVNLAVNFSNFSPLDNVLKK